MYATYTCTNAEFRSTFTRGVDTKVSSGDRIPYIAEHQFAVGAGVEHVNYDNLLFRSYVVDSIATQLAAALAQAVPTTDAYYEVDVHIESPEIKKGMNLYLDITNLFANDCIVA